jgi:hypothetical protein
MALNSEKINFHEFVHIDNLAWTNGTSIEEDRSLTVPTQNTINLNLKVLKLTMVNYNKD